MLGYTRYDDGVEVFSKSLGWAAVLATLFGAYVLYESFTTMLAVDGELVGQAKKIRMVTPLWSSICPTYYALDVSMGIIQNGTGSMSTQDVWFTIKDTADLPAMQKAVETAAIVKMKFDTRRLAACTEDYYATGFQVINKN